MSSSAHSYIGFSGSALNYFLKKLDSSTLIPGTNASGLSSLV